MKEGGIIKDGYHDRWTFRTGKDKGKDSGLAELEASEREKQESVP